MPESRAYSAYSFTRLLAAVGGAVDARLGAARMTPCGVEVALPDDPRADLFAEVAPHTQALEPW